MCVLLKIVSIISFFYLANLTSLYLKQWHFFKKKKSHTFASVQHHNFQFQVLKLHLAALHWNSQYDFQRDVDARRGRLFFFFPPMAAKVLFSHGQITNLNSIKHNMLSVTQDISESWEVPTNKQKLMWLQKRPWRTISRMETFLKSMSSRLQEVTDCKDFHQTYIKNYISLSK